jgi:hypothetical protein
LVTGKVYLQVNQNSVSCGSIGARVIGGEHTAVKYTTSTGSGKHRKTTTRTARSSSHFMDVSICLATIPNDTLTPGCYEYPFSFTVPNGAPASMNCNGRSSCSVSYVMEVWLNRPGLMRWDIKNKRMFLVVSEVSANSVTPLIMEPSMQPVSTMCCFKRGEVYAGAVLSSAMLVSGGQTTIKYAIQNVSTSRINAIEISVVERIYFHARGHGSTRMNIVLFVRLDPRTANFDMGALSKEAIKEQREKRAARGQGAGHGRSAADSDVLESLHHILSGENHKFDALVSAAAKSTFRGNLITVSHQLQIKIVTPYGTSNPVFTRPLLMFSRSSRDQGATTGDGYEMTEPEFAPQSMPADWAPVVAARAELPAFPLMATAVTFDVDPEQQQNESSSNGPVIYPACANPLASAPALAAVPGGPLAAAAAAKGAASAPAVPAGVNGLLGMLQGSYDPCGMLDLWLSNPANKLSQLSPDDFSSLFKTLRDVAQQLNFADLLAKRLDKITCGIVAKSALGADEMVRREVVEKLLQAGPLVDKADHIEDIQQVLTQFQYMTVEQYIK